MIQEAMRANISNIFTELAISYYQELTAQSYETIREKWIPIPTDQRFHPPTSHLLACISE